MIINKQHPYTRTEEIESTQLPNGLVRINSQNIAKKKKEGEIHVIAESYGNTVLKS